MRIIRDLPKTESDFILGKSYIDLVAKSLNKSNDDFLITLEKFIHNNQLFSTKEREFFEYIIELISLNFIIYKWGLLLFHLDNKIYGNFIIIFEIEKKYHLAYEQDGKILLKELDSNNNIFSTIHNKSLVAQMLIDLITRNGKILIVEFKVDSNIYDGSRVSYSQKRFVAQKDEINLLRNNFFKYKKRLKKLQKIFIDNVGIPKGFELI